ncbi:hypothetical protein V6Z11_A05G320200 [Gossypium hirsutum]
MFHSSTAKTKNLIMPPTITPIACKRSFLSSSGEQGPILIQNGEEFQIHIADVKRRRHAGSNTG